MVELVRIFAGQVAAGQRHEARGDGCAGESAHRPPGTPDQRDVDQEGSAASTCAWTTALRSLRSRSAAGTTLKLASSASSACRRSQPASRWRRRSPDRRATRSAAQANRGHHRESGKGVARDHGEQRHAEAIGNHGGEQAPRGSPAHQTADPTPRPPRRARRPRPGWRASAAASVAQPTASISRRPSSSGARARGRSQTIPMASAYEHAERQHESPVATCLGSNSPRAGA